MGKTVCVVASCMPPNGDLTHNPGICPDWELNQRPFGSQASTQSTEQHSQDCLSYSFTVILVGLVEGVQIIVSCVATSFNLPRLPSSLFTMYKFCVPPLFR